MAIYRFTVNATIEGVTGPLVIEEESINDIWQTIQKLREYDLLAAHAAETQAPPRVCEYHGPMKESTKRPGTYYCPSKMGDGSYCKSKA